MTTQIITEFNEVLISLALNIAEVCPNSVIGTHIIDIQKMIKNEKAELLVLNAKLESDIAAIEDPAEKKEFMEMFGLAEPGINRLARASYKLLDLITYFTVGEKEVRAWTIRRGWNLHQ